MNRQAISSGALSQGSPAPFAAPPSGLTPRA
jgi:hypothetical protein